MAEDIRWKQRFQNFDRAFLLLKDALKNGPAGLSALEKEGVIQRFEYTFELAWKTLKDAMEEDGMTISPLTPRQVLKDAFNAKILPDGQLWIDMLEHRNLLSHTYDAAVFEKVVNVIHQRYLKALQALQDWLKSKGAS
jgi:nucleotidyltransferase substrate binding protein (TIGR01987 family)